MMLSANMFEQSSTDGVLEILLCSTPFQIINRIIGFISVFVIYLRKIVLVMYVRFRNKSMNIVIDSASVLLKRDPKIAVLSNSWFDRFHNGEVIRKNFSIRGYVVQVIPPINRLHFFS